MSTDLTTGQPPASVTTVDGETRPVIVVWASGAWGCPFCGSPNNPCDPHYQTRPWGGPCGNPACIVGGAGSAPRVAEIRLAEQREKEASSQRAWLTAYQEKQAAEKQEARGRAVADFAAQAEEHGYCMRCWGNSTSWGLWLNRQKIIKHRNPGNCPMIRRRR